MRLLIRCEASSAIGGGHAMRCLALAEASGEAVFAMRSGAELITRHGQPVEHLVDGGVGALIDIIHKQRCDAAVIDDWMLQESGIRELAAVVPVLRLDDSGFDFPSAASLVLNPNVGIDVSDYPAMPQASLLLGPRYSLMRRAFSIIPRVVRRQGLFVGFGAADPVGFTLIALKALITHGDFDIVVVVGPANDRLEEIRLIAKANSRIQVYSDPPNLPALLGGCALALLSASGMVWEAMSLGTPVLAVAIAENQRRNAACLDSSEVAESLGWYADLPASRLAAAVTSRLADSAWLAHASSAGRALVDGFGAMRAIAALGQVVSRRVA